MSNQDRNPNMRDVTERESAEAARQARERAEREAAEASRYTREPTESDRPASERGPSEAPREGGTVTGAAGAAGAATGTAARRMADTGREAGRQVTETGREAGRQVTETVSRTRKEPQVSWEEMRAQMGREPGMRERSWLPAAGGILSIMSGSWNILAGGGAIFGANLLSDLLASFNIFEAAGISGQIGTGIGIALLVAGILSVIGGILAISRRAWWFAMLGAVVAMIPSPIVLPMLMGFLATIFTGLGKRDFGHHEATY